MSDGVETAAEPGRLTLPLSAAVAQLGEPAAEARKGPVCAQGVHLDVRH